MNERSGPDKKPAVSSESIREEQWLKTRTILSKLPHLLDTLKHAITGSNENNALLLTLDEVADAIAKDPALLQSVRDFLGPNGEGYTINDAAGKYKERLSPLVLKRSAKEIVKEKKEKK